MNSKKEDPRKQRRHQQTMHDNKNLSKPIWKLKDSNQKTLKIIWSIKKIAAAYNNISNLCSPLPRGETKT